MCLFLKVSGEALFPQFFLNKYLLPSDPMVKLINFQAAIVLRSYFQRTLPNSKGWTLTQTWDNWFNMKIHVQRSSKELEIVHANKLTLLMKRNMPLTFSCNYNLIVFERLFKHKYLVRCLTHLVILLMDSFKEITQSLDNSNKVDM